MVYLLIVCMKLITYNNYLEGVDFEPLLYSFILSCTIERPRGGCCLLIQIHCETIFVIQCEHIKTFYSQS